MQEEEIAYLQIFSEISRAVLSVLDVEAVLGLIAERIVRPLGIKASALRLLDERTHRLELAASHGLSDEYLGKGALFADRSIADALRGRPVLVENAPADDRIQYREEARAEGIASMLSVPMLVKGRIIGVLRIYTAEPRRFSQKEIDLISAIAEIGAIAIDNARIFEAKGAELSELFKVGGIYYEYEPPVAEDRFKPGQKGEIGEQKSYRYFRTLYRLTRTITSTMEMKDLLDAVAREIAEALLVRGCCLFWLNILTRELEPMASYGLSDAYVRKGPLSMDKSIPRVLNGRAVCIADVRTDAAIQYPEEAQKEGIFSMLSVPISVKEKVRGILRLYSSTLRPFDAEEIEFANVLAEISGIAIVNAKLYQERTNDITFWKTTLDYLGIGEP
jgi:signal transduction protein with GAF and PtsI domain